MIRYLIFLAILIFSCNDFSTNEQTKDMDENINNDPNLNIESENEASHKRSEAAMTLQKNGDPRALKACLATLNDGEDELHLDWTPSVRCLIEIGAPAFLELMPFLLDDDEITRLRAQRAVEGISMKMFGLNAKATNKEMKPWKSWWKENGYTFDSSKEDCERAVLELKEWFDSNNK